ncbi:MAG TPA: ADOP family duplicated permease [Gemmatimonadales bacterium]|nr:ADOP family duplicated permease [Gemmatimonadales bacterium]
MSWFHGLRYRLRTVLRPGDHARELDEEFRFHLDLDATQQGDTDRAARRFGNRTGYQEEVRYTTWFRYIDPLTQDFRAGWRSLRRNPGLAAGVVATLGLGIGVNAAVFSLLDRLYLRPPSGIEDPGSLRRIWIHHFNSGDGVPFTSQGLSYPAFKAVADASGDSAGLAAYSTDNAVRMGRRPVDPRLRVVYASANYFDVLGVRPARGRLYTAQEDRFGNAVPVAVISHAFWNHRLGGADSALGSSIPLGTDSYTIIGVLPPDFTGLDLQAADVWVPLASLPPRPWLRGPWWESDNMWGFRAIQRQPAGGSIAGFEERATHLIRALNARMNPDRPDTLMQVYTGSIIEAQGPGKPGKQLIISTRLAGVALIILVIACANVANLLLARAVSRRREVAIRLAVGISRWRLVRLLTAETLLLAGLAALGALLMAEWGGGVLRSLLLPDIEWTDPVLDGRVVVFAGLAALASGLVAGLLPAFQASRTELTDALKAGSRHAGLRRSRLRNGLAVVQAALSVILLAGAALFVRSLQNVQRLDLGFDADRLLFGRVEFAEGEAPAASVSQAALRQVIERLGARPEVEAIARTAIEPMLGWAGLSFFTSTDSSESFRGPAFPIMSEVSPEYFRTVGLRLLSGHTFTSGSPPEQSEVVVNQRMADLLWPGLNPLGRCIRFRKRDSPCSIVVGVVENSRRGYVIEPEPFPQYYLPLGTIAEEAGGGAIIVRTSAERREAAYNALMTELKEAFPAGYPQVTSMTENLEPEYRPWRLGATLFTAFGLLALVVALVGFYSNISYGVSQRTQEFGVRMALGARVVQVIRQVMGEGLRIVAFGAVVGVGLTLAGGRLLRAMLYGVEPNNPRVLVLVCGGLLAVAALAALIPAIRATRVDPVQALNTE